MKEYDRQRASVPTAALIPGQYGYATKQVENRALVLEEKDLAFLDFIRSGKEQKGLVEDATGQFLISPVITTLIDREVEKLCIMRALCSKKTIAKDRLQVREISEVSVGWGKLETGTGPTESDLVPGLPVLKHVEDVYGLSKIGEDELADSDINLANLLVDSFSKAIAAAEELAFVSGGGHDSQQPEGFTVNETLVGAAISTTAAAAVTVEKFLEMIYTCPSKFRRDGVFLVHSITALALRNLRAKTADGTYEGAFLWQPSLIAGQPATFLGYPIYTQDDMSTLAGTAQVIASFGNFSEGYRILDHAGGQTIQRLVELYSEAGLVGYKIHKRVGGYCVRPANKAIVLLTEKGEA
ncbi:hypothetical protein ES708_13630 [subsurface metagenome]